MVVEGLFATQLEEDELSGELLLHFDLLLQFVQKTWEGMIFHPCPLFSRRNPMLNTNVSESLIQQATFAPR